MSISGVTGGGRTRNTRIMASGPATISRPINLTTVRELWGNGMRIEILCTGDEILTGKTVNTNYSHIAQRLGEAGLEVCWGTTVGGTTAPASWPPSAWRRHGQM